VRFIDRSAGDRRRGRRRPDDADVRAEVTAATADLARSTAWRRRPTRTARPDRRSSPATAGAVVAADLERDLGDEQQEQALDAVVERLRAIDVGTVRSAATCCSTARSTPPSSTTCQRGELLSLPVALVVMVVVFGGVLAAGLPLVAALSTIAGALLVLLGASYAMDLSPDVVSVVTVLGLGLAIDYGLLIVSRFREERARGLVVADAVVRTCATAGRTVAFSGVTVAVALCGLLVLDDPTFRSMGAAGIAVVLVAVAAPLTLTPALLALLGPRLRVRAVSVRDDGGFARLARRGSGGPLLLALATAAVLRRVGRAVPGRPLHRRRRRAHPPLLRDPAGRADLLVTRFEGSEADPVPRRDAPARRPARARGVAERVEQLPQVRSVRQPSTLSDGVTSVEVVPTGTRQATRRSSSSGPCATTGPRPTRS
jgi:RND superfamily putative drug exporter